MELKLGGLYSDILRDSFFRTLTHPKKTAYMHQESK